MEKTKDKNESIVKINLGRGLYAGRSARNYSQEDAAAAIGITSRQYLDLERSKRTPKLYTFLNYAIIFEVDLNQFLRKIVQDGYKVEDYRNSLDYSQNKD